MKLTNSLCCQEDINQIHQASLRIMAEKGLALHSEKARGIFAAHGAKVEGEVVFIQPDMVEKALQSLPDRFVMKGRNPKFDVEIGGGQPCYCLPNGPVFIKKGDSYYSSTSEDVINFIKLAENSPVINMISPWVTTANDVAEDKQLAYQMAVSLRYSTKPLMGLTAGYEKSKFSIDLIRKFYGDHDSFVALGLISPMSPLVYDDRMLEAVVAYSEENQPMLFSSAVLPGVTGPVTMAGALALANAEVLAGIVLSQLVRPGVPVIYGNAGGSADLRYITPAIGSPEAGLVAIYTKGLADKYKIPCRSGGALSDSKMNDMQAGIETTLVTLATVLSGQDFVLHGAGILDSYNVISYDKFLMDEEMVKMCAFMKAGVTVNETTLGLEPIFKVAHGAQFLMEKHTVKNMKSSLLVPAFFEKGNYPAWRKNGEPTAVANALKKVEDRLAAYPDTPLTAEQESLLAPHLDVF